MPTGNRTRGQYVRNANQEGYWTAAGYVKAAKPARDERQGWLCTESGTPGKWQAIRKPDTEYGFRLYLFPDSRAMLKVGGVGEDGGRKARCIKLEIKTKGEGVRMREVRLWGWPIGR